MKNWYSPSAINSSKITTKRRIFRRRPFFPLTGTLTTIRETITNRGLPVATNKAKDYLNSAYSRRVTLAADEETSVETIASIRQDDPSEQPDEVYISKESSGTIEQMIRSLKEPYREVCVLRFLEEKDTQEIAQLLGRPKKTVETQLYRARAILQKQIKEVYSYEK